jgi:hypothetical protein
MEPDGALLQLHPPAQILGFDRFVASLAEKRPQLAKAFLPLSSPHCARFRPSCDDFA